MLYPLDQSQRNDPEACQVKPIEGGQDRSTYGDEDKSRQSGSCRMSLPGAGFHSPRGGLQVFPSLGSSSGRIGCRGLLVQAESAEARSFYLLGPEFEASPTDDLHLVLLMNVKDRRRNSALVRRCRVCQPHPRSCSSGRFPCSRNE